MMAMMILVEEVEGDHDFYGNNDNEQFDINDHHCNCIHDHYYHHLYIAMLIMMLIMSTTTILLKLSRGR